MSQFLNKTAGLRFIQWLGKPSHGIFIAISLFSMLFTFGDVLRPLTQRGHLLVFEAEINSSRAGESQIFWNDGRGYRGRYSSTQKITRPQEWTRVVLPLTGRSIDGLRFDPLDGEAIINLRNMRVRTLHGQVIRNFDFSNIGESEFIRSIEQVADTGVIRVTVINERDPQFVFHTDYPIRVPIGIVMRYVMVVLHLGLLAICAVLLWRFGRRWGWRGAGTLLSVIAALWLQGLLLYFVFHSGLFPLPLGQTLFQLAVFVFGLTAIRPLLHTLGKREVVSRLFERVGSPQKPVRVWLLLGGGFGLVLVFLTPPYQSPDEYNWFYRAFHISEGHWLPQIHEQESPTGEKYRDAGGLFPYDLRALMNWTGGTAIVFRPHIKADLDNLLEVRSRFNSEDPRVFQHLRDTLHSLPPYLAQAAGIRITRELGGTLLDQFYGGRLGNLMVCLLLGVIVLRTYPPMAWVFVALFCNPLSLFLIASNSHDPLVNMLCVLLIALILRMREAKGPIRATELVSLLTVLLLILISKFNYVILLPLLLLIPAHRFRGWRHQATVLGTIALAMAAGLGLLFYGLSFYPSGDWGQPDIDRRERLLHCLAHPWQTLTMFSNTIVRFGMDYARQIAGVLGWLDTDIGSPARWLWATAATLATAAMAFHPNRIPLRMIERCFVALIALAVFFSILGIFLLIWTPTGITHIIGVQGRYFLMLLPLVALTISPASNWDERREPILVNALISLVIVSLCLTVYWSYYRYWAPLPEVNF